MKDNKWARLLAYVTGLVNQELLLQNEYLVAENRILRSHIPKRLRLSDPQRATLAEIGKRLGRKALREVACVAEPETILAWYRRLIAQKLTGLSTGERPGGHLWQQQLRNWPSAWRARIPAGATTALSGH
jgi:putative transposase